jgi:hypothetical protein
VPEDNEIQAVQSDLEELTALLDSQPEPESIPGRALQATPESLLPDLTAAILTARSRVHPARETIDRTLDALPAKDSPAEKSSLALQALTAVGTLEAAVNDVAATGGASITGSPTTPQPSGPLAAFIGKLKSILAKIQSGILSFLSKYMTFQSWSIAGELTGGVPWLSGSATLTLNFGS